LADALNEIRELKQRTSQLEQIVQENEDLHQFVWFTADGTTLPIHKIDDDHMEKYRAAPAAYRTGYSACHPWRRYPARPDYSSQRAG